MLHTQEKILRYELAQKRKLLTELKEELEYSREKWSQAREKNSNTEQQWRQLRTEFASRRNTIANDNSVESGYSDDRESSGASSDEEPGYETDVSENAQKTSGNSDDVEDLSDIKEGSSGATILSLIEDKMVEIVCSDSTGVNDVHSEQKTDSVLNQDSTEKTDIIPEEILQIGGPSQGEETGKCQTVSEQSAKMGECRETTEKSAATSQEVPVRTEESSTSPEARLMTTEPLKEGLGSKEAQEHMFSNEKEYNTHHQDLEVTAGCSREGGKPRQSLEEVLAQRDERLKRLEGQTEQLVTKVTNTTNKSVVISNKLDDLHEVYGQDSSIPSENSVSDNEVPSTDVGVDIRPTEDNQE